MTLLLTIFSVLLVLLAGGVLSVCNIPPDAPQTFPGPGDHMRLALGKRETRMARILTEETEDDLFWTDFWIYAD